MRMWMINPKLLCKKHLLGEHNELHKHRPSFIKKHSISGRITPIVQIQPGAMEKRHLELSFEMISRNYNHNSPYDMPDISYLPSNEKYATVDVNNSINNLKKRCSDCKKRIDIFGED